MTTQFLYTCDILIQCGNTGSFVSLQRRGIEFFTETLSVFYCGYLVEMVAVDGEDDKPAEFCRGLHKVGEKQLPVMPSSFTPDTNVPYRAEKGFEMMRLYFPGLRSWRFINLHKGLNSLVILFR